MRKSLILLCAILLSGFALRAQSDIFESSENSPYFGARLSLDISCPTNISGPDVVHGVHTSIKAFNNAAGFEIGGIYNIPLWKNLYFEPGLSLYYNTMKFHDGFLAGVEDIHGVEKVGGSVRRFGFRMPLVAGYRFDFEPVAISVFTGPVLSLGLFGRTHIDGDGQVITVSRNSNCFADDGICRRTDIGWRFGVGGTWGNYVLQVYGTVGACNMFKNGGNLKYHDNNVAIALGYNF